MSITEYKCYIYIIKNNRIIKKDYNITIRQVKKDKIKTIWKPERSDKYEQKQK